MIMKKYILHLMVLIPFFTNCAALDSTGPDYKYDKKASESKEPPTDCDTMEYVVAGCEEAALEKAEKEAGE